MSDEFPVSVLIFTLNEEIHLPACLASLSWCDDVIVIDSYSDDRTEAICREAGIDFYQHGFEGFGAQRNWALDHVPMRHDWVLILDADERVPQTMAEELAVIARRDPPDVGAYRVRRRFHLWGRWLRHSGLYPSWVVRFVRRDRVRYSNRGHAETQTVQGIIGDLSNDLIDENLKGIDEWFARQNRYSRKDADYECEIARDPARLRIGELFARDPLTRRRRLKHLAGRLPARALWYFLYSYLWRGGFLEGKDGLMFCLMKAMYQQMIVIKKYDHKRRL